MMVSMAEEDRDGGGAEAALTLRIESEAIAWSSAERERWLALRIMSWSTGLAVVALGVGMPFDSTLLVGVSAIALACGAVAGVGAALVKPSRSTTPRGVVECRGEALRIGDRTLALADVRQGWIEDVFGEGEACDVVLRTRAGHDVAVRVQSRAEGESLLRAARASVASRVLRIPLRSLASSQRFGEAMGLASLGVLVPSLFAGVGGLIWFMIMFALHGSPMAGSSGPAILVALLLALSAFSLLGVGWLARFLRRGEVVVGTDGVALEGSGKRRFIAYGRVRRVARDARGVRLYLNDGVSVLLPTKADADAPLPLTPGVMAAFDPTSVKRGVPRGLPVEELFRKDVARREALFERVEQAMRARGQSRVSSVQLAQLDRGRRSLPAWRDALRALPAVEGAGYRGAALASDQLAEVVEDAGAPTERRIAAALALSGNGDAEARQRVRIAVEACADDDLRAALAQAAEGEIEEPKLARAMKRRGESP
jgi:hypothetical protein